VAVYAIYHLLYYRMMGYQRELGFNLLVTLQAQVIAGLHKQVFSFRAMNAVTVRTAYFIPEVDIELT